MGIELVLDEEMLNNMKKYIERRGFKMTPNNEKQCYVPNIGTVFKNAKGTAPGFAVEKNGKMAVALPGPPREMEYMFQDWLRPILETKTGSVMYYKIIRTIGIGESQLETEIEDLIESAEHATIATYAKTGECSLRVAAKMPTEEEAIAEVEKTIKLIEKRIGKFIYSLEDEELKTVVARKLLERNISISSVESCTGGKFAAALTDMAGVSKVFDRGIVTYSNNAKVEELGILESIINEHGAVSEEVATQMAEKLFAKTGSDICIAVTGIAGPDGGTDEKPVGTVFIAVTYEGSTHTKKCNLLNVGRDSVRNSAVLQMYNMLNKIIG